VVASEEHPTELAIGERLRSRLLAGLAAEVTRFAEAERSAFAAARAAALRTPLPGWAVGRIAAADFAAMRLLNGAVCAAVGLARAGQLEPARLDAEIVRLGGMEASSGRLTDRQVLEVVAAHFGVPQTELAGRSRSGAVRDARAVAAAVLKGRGQSLSQVSAVLGGRDPSTVAGVIDRGRALLESIPELRSRVAG
jgi:chromosomal replication initiation ATPase DnaA